MKKYIIIVSTLVLCLSSYIQARDISPTFSIRYEDFINSASPSAAIGLKLDIDGERYTGFQVNSDGSDSRLLVGWGWGVIGIGALTGAADAQLPHYTFGVGLEVVPGLSTNFEYCMTPTAETDDITANANAANRLRLSLSVGWCASLIAKSRLHKPS